MQQTGEKKLRAHPYFWLSEGLHYSNFLFCIYLLNLETCSILYNRGLYPEESFSKVKKYGLPMLLTQDEGVKSFISGITSQLSGKPFLIFVILLRQKQSTACIHFNLFVIVCIIQSF